MSVDPVSLAVTAALTAAQMALQMTNKIEGPRLDSLDVTVADYGTPLNYFYGLRRFTAVPIIWAEPIREVKRKSKTKGGKYNEYSYFGSWAVVVADHLIDRVTRIWFDKHLVYDVTGAGPIHPFNIGTTHIANKGKGSRTVNINLDDHLRIYLGTEDQVADARMVADVEAKHGAGSCPDYKGVAYIVFEEIPLEKFGNRIPQISVEALLDEVPTYPNDGVDTSSSGSRLWNAVISDDGKTLFQSSGTYFDVVDIPSRTSIARGSFAHSINLSDRIGILSDGSMMAVGSNNSDLILMTRFGVQTVQSNYFGSDDQQSLWAFVDGAGVQHWLTGPWSTFKTFFHNGEAISPIAVWGYNFTTKAFCKDAYGDIWGVGTEAVTSSHVFLFRIVAVSGRAVSDFIAITMPNVKSGAGLSICHNEEAGHFVVRFANELHLIDDETLSLISYITPSYLDTYVQEKQFANIPPNANSAWLGAGTSSHIMTEVDLRDLSTIRTVDLDDWGGSIITDSALYIPLLHAIATWDGGGTNITFRYLDRPTSDGTTLETVINDISQRCGLDLALVDASEMTQTLNYSWTRGTGRDILEPPLDVYDSIVRPHDFGLEFIKLGRASLGTLSFGDFVADRGQRARYDLTIEQDTDLPRRVTVNYSDITADQQPNVAMDQRAADTVDSVRELSINLTTLAMEPDEAQRLTERWLRRKWFGRETYGFGVTAQELALEPGDVFDIDLDGLSKRARITATTIEKRGAIQLEFRRDDPLIATLSGSTGQPADGHVDEVLLIPMPTKAFILDSTLIKDADEDTVPMLYIGAGPQADGTWLGASIFEARDGLNYDTEVANIPSYFPASWGYTTAALYDVETCGLWDRGAGVNVVVPYGSLTSITEAEADADPLLNRIIFESGEQIQFTVATLESDGSYTLTGLKRGRRGTEWGTGLHTAGEAFILADGTLIMDRGASDVAHELYFKAMGAGDNLETAPVTSFTYLGRTHMPYAPANLEARKLESGDWVIDAIRRTRVGGAWTGGGTIPLGETTEAYELDLSDGVTTVTKEITSFPYTWTAAAQTTDTGGDVAIGSLDVTAYQMSDLAGRGFPAAGSF